MNLSKLREAVEDRESWPAAVHGSPRVRHEQETEQQQQQNKYMSQISIHSSVAGRLGCFHDVAVANRVG